MSGITFFTEMLKAKTNEKDISSCIFENTNKVNDNINISKKSKYFHYFCLYNDVLDDTDADSSVQMIMVQAVRMIQTPILVTKMMMVLVVRMMQLPIQVMKMMMVLVERTMKMVQAVRMIQMLILVTKKMMVLVVRTMKMVQAVRMMMNYDFFNAIDLLNIKQ